MNEQNFNSTQMLKIHAPGLAWLPRVVRDKLTPALVGSAITTAFMAIAYIFNSPQKDIQRVQEIIAQQQVHEAKTDELLQQLVTGQAVMNAAMGDFRDEQDRQREWRDRLSEIAETPPHARRRPK